MMNTATKITKVLQRSDGSEVRIVAQACFGFGLKRSIDYYVHKRESPDHTWRLLSKDPHPDWRTMSVDEYIRRGRSEVFQALSHGEIFKVTNALAH